MNEEETKQFNPQLLKQILVKLEAIDTRLQLVESRLDRHSLDTRPIWEKALAEIMDVKHNLSSIDRKIDIIGKDLLNLRADHLDIDRRVGRLEEDARGTIQTVN